MWPHVVQVVTAVLCLWSFVVFETLGSTFNAVAAAYVTC
jgi:hypothetical protein